MNEIDKVAVCSRSFSKNEFLRNHLLSKYKNVTFNDDGLSLSGNSLIDFLKGHSKAITALEKIDSGILKELPDLKAIGKYGVGLDMINLEDLQNHNVQLGWTPGVNKRSVAELVLSFIINLARGIHFSNNQIKNGTWKQYKGPELSSMTVGIIGCGNVGKEVTKILSFLGAKILVHDIKDYPDFYKEYNLKNQSLEEILKLSDVISIHTPLTDKTRNLFNKDTILKMKKGSFLINTARGGIVDENALTDLLTSNHLLGAAFDVFLEEPVNNEKLINLPNFLSTPHIGGSSENAIKNMGLAAIEGLDNNFPANHYMDKKNE